LPLGIEKQNLVIYAPCAALPLSDGLRFERAITVSWGFYFEFTVFAVEAFTGLAATTVSSAIATRFMLCVTQMII
jgi:hypothetical protein